MYFSNEMMQYFHQVNTYLQTQSKQMADMTTMIQQLQRDIRKLQANMTPPPTKNEYKFDLLKIERLEGTLNIGLNPKGSDASIDEMSVDQSMNVPSSKNKENALFQNIHHNIKEYLDQDAVNVLVSMEHKYNYPLDESYRKFILDDVKKQIDQRIRYYINQVNTEALEPRQMTDLAEKTTQQVEEDIKNTIEAFIRHLPKEHESSS
ncbi:spore germination protein GerPC [Brevibacillus ginsengisoli]|uniref:spore germination protein GerPC n=1 Tax=Brevibacillus ginsengisoli TaxID=363854 RepID=UPI003CEDD3F7